MATVIVGGIGAGIGYLAGGAKGARLGWAIGTTIGSVYDSVSKPSTQQDYGKLTDLRLSGSAYGAAYPMVWGHVKLGSNVIWIAEDSHGRHLVEHKQTESQGGGGGSGGVGGGGAKTTTYTYTTSFAVGICQGTIYDTNGNPISRLSDASLSRIWADDVIIWDRVALGDGGGLYDPENPQDVANANGISLATYNSYNDTLKSGAKKEVIRKNQMYNAAHGGNLEFDWYSGTDTQTPNSFMNTWVHDVSATYNGDNEVPAYRHLAYIFFKDMEVTDFGNRIPNIVVELETKQCTVADVVSDVGYMCGIDSANLMNLTQGAQVPIEGYTIGSRGSGQDAIAPLLQAYGYDMPEIDGKLTLVRRGSAPVLTVPEADLGAYILEDGDGSDPQNKMTRTLGQIDELPGKVEVAYFTTAGGKYLDQSVQSDYRETSGIENTLTLQFPISLSDYGAKQLAARLLDTAWAEKDTFGFSLPPKYAMLAPGDEIGVQYNNRTVAVRLVGTETGLFGEIRCDAVIALKNPFTYPDSLPSVSGSTSTGTTGYLKPIPASFIAWSGKELRDADQARPGFYVAATGPVGWQGGNVYYSLDGGANWVYGSSIATGLSLGTCTTTLGPGADRTSWDTAHMVDVQLYDTGALAGSTDAQVLSGLQNYAIIGNEIVGFVNAELIGARKYRLSRLRRGARNSVFTGHIANERFVLASNSLARIPVPDSSVGTTVKVKVLSAYQVLADVVAQDVLILPRTLTQVEQDVVDLGEQVDSVETDAKTRMRWAGVYSPLTQYKAYDVVRSEGAIWSGLVDNYGNEPGSDSVHWQLILEAGGGGGAGGDYTPELILLSTGENRTLEGMGNRPIFVIAAGSNNIVLPAFGTQFNFLQILATGVGIHVSGPDDAPIDYYSGIDMGNVSLVAEAGTYSDGIVAEGLGGFGLLVGGLGGSEEEIVISLRRVLQLMERDNHWRIVSDQFTKE